MKREHVCQSCGQRWIENEDDAGACRRCGSWDVRVTESESEEHSGSVKQNAFAP